MRKLATAAAVSLALASGGAFGLGLGDIEMRSALNQPMSAEIPLTSVQAGELDGMIVKLADEAAFARAGIDRSAALTDLTFSVDSSAGRPVIRIASNRPVVEPFLNFLLEVDWPQGRMVREYTVLLDPPVFMTEGPAVRDEGAENRAVIERESAAVAPAPIDRSAADAAADTVEGFEVELLGDDEIETSDASNAGDVVSLDELDADSAALSGEDESGSVSDLQLSDDLFEVEIAGDEVEVGDNVGADGVVTEESLEIVELDEQSAVAQPAEVAVVRGDTLFEIATETAGSGVSTQQMMLALLEANRSAFINDNINLVRAGATLRIPGAAEAQALTQAQALAEIGRQNELWQEYRDNLRRTTAETRVAEAEPEAEAPTESESGTSAEGSSASAGADAAAGEADQDNTDVGTVNGLTAEARAILERARAEVLQRDELSIVTDPGNTATGGSATSEANDEDDSSAQVATINRELQLAREELAASGVEGDDLDEQVAELTSTGENLDALINLRENQVARLEEQLAQARADAEAADAAAAEVAAELEADASMDSDADGALDIEGSVDEAVDEASDAASNAAADAGALATDTANDAVDAVDAGADALGEQAADAAGDAADGVAGAADAASEAASDAVDDATTAAADLADEVTSGAEEAGAEAVAAVDSAVGTAADPASDPASDAASDPAEESWFKGLLNDPTRMMIAAAGGIGLLGVLGLLLFRRRRDDDVDEEMAVEFGEGSIDDPNVAESLADDGVGFGETAGVTAAAATGAAGLAAADMTSGGREESPDLDVEMQSDFDAALQEEDDKDDTISEVDVYLAYGLHGQAEELLTKAIERKPDNGEYSQKLLETYHAQGNGEGFQRVAADFHSRFGGEGNPAWPRIAEMGRDLRPGEPLFGAGVASVAAMGSGQLDGPAMSDDDFAGSLGGSGSSSSSVSRDFSTAEETIDEEALLDQSIDPAFAFDENDLEATGDFSQIADELAAERNETIDFSGFEEDANTPADQGQLSELPSESSALDEALTLDELDMAASSAAANDAAKDRAADAADDLVLDFDELDGTDLDATSLDEAALMDAMPNSDLSLDDQSTDEMDTMLDLAKAYLDMGDKDSASSALDEIVKGGSPAQVTEAETLLRKIS